MPNTYTQLYIQIVFAVKGRQHFIEKSIREKLEKYITGIITNHKQKLFAIYAMPDHIHILVSIKPDIALSNLVRDIKANSSRWLKEQHAKYSTFSWQEGFGGFSYSKSQIDNVVNYVLNQEEHHRQKTFKEEYVEFLQAFEIEFDNKYLFEFY